MPTPLHTLFTPALGPGGLGVGVARRAEDGDEHLRGAHLAGSPVDDLGDVPGVVDEELLAGAVLLAITTSTRLAQAR